MEESKKGLRLEERKNGGGIVEMRTGRVEEKWRERVKGRRVEERMKRRKEGKEEWTKGGEEERGGRVEEER